MGAGDLARVGVLLADPTRAALLAVLMDGRARTAGELARRLAVAPSTASEHLSRLLDAQFVAVQAQGRHRYYRLAGPQIAQLIETVGAVDLPPPSGPPARAVPPDLAFARSCYDHLAGRLGVHLHDRLVDHDHLRYADHHLTLTPSGHDLLAGLGITPQALRSTTRPTARSCLDWTERRPHLAGAAGAALFEALLARRWIARGARPRSIRLTGTGRQRLPELLGTGPLQLTG